MLHVSPHLNNDLPRAVVIYDLEFPDVTWTKYNGQQATYRDEGRVGVFKSHPFDVFVMSLG